MYSLRPVSPLRFITIFAAAAVAGTLAFTQIASGQEPPTARTAKLLPVIVKHPNGKTVIAKPVVVKMSATRQELRRGQVQTLSLPMLKICRGKGGVHAH